MKAALYPRDADLSAVNYREVLATILPALVLSYVLLWAPLIYAGGAIAADQVMGGVAPSTVDYALNKLVFPGAFLLSLMLHLAERPAWSGDARVTGPMLGAFLLFCLLSALWAIAPARTVSQVILVSMVLATVAMAAQVSGSLAGIFRAIFLVFAATLAINLLAVLFMPAGPLGHQGIYAHKNGLGSISALGLLMGLYGFHERGKLRLVGCAMLPLAVIMLWMSQSKTSLGLVLIVPVLASALWFSTHYLRIALVLGVLLSGAALGFMIWVFSNLGYSLGDLSMLASEDRTFTGRTAIWNFASGEIVHKPLLGHGFRSFWGIGDGAPQLHAAPGFVQVTPHGHNGYVDLLLEVGSVGLGLFGLLYLAAIARIGEMFRRLPAVGFVSLCLVLFFALHNLLESSWFEPLDASTVVLAVILLSPIARSGRALR